MSVCLCARGLPVCSMQRLVMCCKTLLQSLSDLHKPFNHIASVKRKRDLVAVVQLCWEATTCVRKSLKLFCSNTLVMQTCYSANQHWLFPFLLTTSSPPQQLPSSPGISQWEGELLDRLVDGKCCLLIVVKRLFHALRYYSALHNGSFVQKWVPPPLLRFSYGERFDFY